MQAVIAIALLSATVGTAQTNEVQLATIDMSDFCAHGAITNTTVEWGWTDADYIDAMAKSGELTNVVKRLAKDGHICAVLGHNWRGGRPGEVSGDNWIIQHLDYHPGVTYRTCRVCGVCQSKTEGEWK